MKANHFCYYLEADKKLKKRNKILKEILRILTIKDIIFGTHGSKTIKHKISYRFNNNGWGDKIKIKNTNLTISFLKSRIGVCCQLGNVARTYADILKLAVLYKNKIIDVGIIIVPLRNESKKLGANYAQFERLSNELKHFKSIINIPILIIGLSN